MILIFETSKHVFSGTCFDFDICNPKLFTFESRSSIVPSLQNIKNIQFLTIIMSKKCNFVRPKGPAGRLSDLWNINKYVSWYLFRLWYMQSEAFRDEKSFEHSPKPSKHPNYTVCNDSNVENVIFKKMSTSIFDRC